MSLLQGEIARIIQETQSATPNPLFDALLAERLLAAAGEESDLGPLREVIQRALHETEECRAILERVLRQVDALEVYHTHHPQFTEAWWSWKREALGRALRADPEAGRAEWLRTYAAALLGWELTALERLADGSLPAPPADAGRMARFAAAAHALQAEEYGAPVLEVLDELVQATTPGSAEPVLGATTRALLLVFAGRIHLYRESAPAAALACFQQAAHLAQGDGRPQAALGEYFRVLGDADGPAELDETAAAASARHTGQDTRQQSGPVLRHQELALHHQQRAIELSPDLPDGYIGKGRLLEEQGLWDEADDQYAQAIEVLRRQEVRDLDLELRKLLAPVTGNLYLQLARMLRSGDPEGALQAVTRALALGIRHRGEYPARLGNRLKGEILEGLGRPQEAAAALYQAGIDFLVRGEAEVAVELLRRAVKGDERHVLAYWALADALRVSSQRSTPPFVERSLLRESAACWEKGATLRLPSSDDAWAYAARASICEQQARLVGTDRWTLGWQAVTYLERALVLRPRDGYRWTDLGRLYRLVRAHAGALHATARAVELDPQNVGALEERIITLTNLGEFEEALRRLAEREALEANPWHEAVRAFIRSREEDYAGALELIEAASRAVTEEVIWFLELRALCNRKLGRRDRAAEDYERIWKKKHPEDRDNRFSFGAAAYHLGDPDEAIRILYPLSGDLTETAWVSLLLGFSYLARGEVARGEEALADGIAGANPLELRELRRLELPEVERAAREWPHAAGALAVLGHVGERITRREEELAALTARRELHALGERALAQGQRGDWTWVGPQAGRARLALGQERWEEAASLYTLLRDYPERFPEAGAGLGLLVPRLREAARLESVEDYWTLDTAWAALAAELPAEDTLRRGLEAARGALTAFLDEHYGLGAGEAMLPVVVPIAVEIAADLIPEDTGPEWPLLKTHIPEMRTRIQHELGVSVPGVRIRGNEGDLPPGSYLIMLDEVPLVMGTVEREMRYSPASAETLRAAAVAEDDLRAAAHPLTGEPGVWVAPASWEAVERAGLPLWSDPLLYMLAHVEALLRANLADFLGVQEVHNLLESWEQDPGGRALVREALPDAGARLRCVRLLRALVREQVSIAPWREILEVVREIGLTDDVTEAVRAVRLRLRQQLPGNEVGVKRIEVPAAVEDRLVPWVWYQGSKTFFALPPEETQELLAELRELIGSEPQPRLALVTADPELRPFVRRLVELEFPRVVVLSEEELHLPAALDPAGVEVLEGAISYG